MADKDQEGRKPTEQATEQELKDYAASIDENDPHKVEKLTNAGKDTDAAEASE
ncbi:MAG: hypothetical protein ACRYGP_10090 [Janthinobacterium lividum]